MDTLFKRLAIVLVAGSVVACAGGLLYFALFASFPPVEQENDFIAPAQKVVMIDNPGGLTHIVGSERTDIQINATRKVTPRLPWFADSALARFQLVARAEKDRYYLSAKTPAGWRGGSRLELQLEAPAATNVIAHTGFGNVNVHQMRGAIEIVNRGAGTIVLEHILGPVTITAAGGEIRANLLGDHMPVKIRIKSGNVLLNIHSSTPGPLDISIESGIVVLEMRPDVNAMLAYRTTGTVINPYPTGRANPQPGENHAYSMRLGAGGAAFHIEAGQADLTIDQLTANE